MARGSDYKALADAVMDSPNLQKAIEDRVCGDVNIECKKLCSTRQPSLLRTATKDTMLNFSWYAIGQEIKEKAPFFHRLLLASADPKSLKQSINDPGRYPGICAAAAILLKKRDKAMSLVPYIISNILKVGRTSKMVNFLFFTML